MYDDAEGKCVELIVMVIQEVYMSTSCAARLTAETRSARQRNDDRASLRTQPSNNEKRFDPASCERKDKDLLIIFAGHGGLMRGMRRGSAKRDHLPRGVALGRIVTERGYAGVSIG